MLFWRKIIMLKLVNNWKINLKKSILRCNKCLLGKQYIVTLKYEEGFSEKDIQIRTQLCQMNQEYLDLCNKKIVCGIDKKN